MRKFMPIAEVHGREILDSRGNPTVEVEVTLENGVAGRSSVPSGASTGSFEALELRDGEKRYHGLGVMRAVHHVNKDLAKAVCGENVFEQRLIDEKLLSADGTELKSNLGANAILGVSLAAARAAAAALRLPLYRYLGGVNARCLPVPMMNILNGGRHADNTVDLQEFMIMPVGAATFGEGLQMGSEIYHCLKKRLRHKGLSTAVGDEGGFAPDLPNAGEVLSVMSQAVKDAGYSLSEDVVFSLDAAASELYDQQEKAYFFPGESKMSGRKVLRDANEMIRYYEGLKSEFPIFSIEDGLYEDDWNGWISMTAKLGDQTQLVGDDLFVTNPRRLAKGISLGAGNAILVKVNQIGTLSEAMDAIFLAEKNGFAPVISHRSGETEDAFIADLCVAVNAGQIKTGAPCRSDRVAKYNRLLRIEEELAESALYGSDGLIR